MPPPPERASASPRPSGGERASRVEARGARRASAKSGEHREHPTLSLTGRLQRLATVSLIPSLVDVGLLVLLRQGLGWVLVVADLVAIAVASVLSYGLHRLVTFRSDPYVRWVRVPLAFVAVAGSAAVVDVVVLRALFAGTGFDTVDGLVAAKLVAL